MGYLYASPSGGNKLAIYNLTIIDHLKDLAYTAQVVGTYKNDLRFLCMPLYFTEIIICFRILIYFSSTNFAENLNVSLSRNRISRNLKEILVNAWSLQN